MANDEEAAGKVGDLVAGYFAAAPCSREGCGNQGSAIPKFTFRPVVGYTGPPVEMLVRLPLCPEHHAWFNEVGAAELIEDGVDTEGNPRQGFARIVAAAGVKVDVKLTTWELVPLGGAK